MLAVVTTVIAVVLLILLGLTMFGRRPRRWLVPAVALVAVLIIGFCSRGLPTFYRSVMTEYPVSSAVPVGVAAWALAGLGAIAVLIAAVATSGESLSRKPLVAVGLILGLVTGFVATSIAVKAGNDARYIALTTADPTEIPAMPTSFGARQFTIQLSDSPVIDSQTDWMLRPAGAGFVVLTRGEVVAYASNGKARWKYERTGPGDNSVNALEVFDGGRTVVLYSEHQTVALDAVTGQTLWAEASPPLSVNAGSLWALGSYVPRQFPISRDSRNGRWNGFDARTGQQLWTFDEPDKSCQPAYGESARHAVGVYACEGRRVRLMSIDPVTGTPDWDIELPGPQPAADERNSVSIRPAGTGVAVTIEESTFVVDVDNHNVSALQPGQQVAATQNSSGAFLVTLSPYPFRYELRRMDGSVECRLPPDTHVGKTMAPLTNSPDLEYVVLQDQIVLDNTGGPAKVPNEIQVFDRADCARADQLPGVVTIGLLSAPGVTLVLRVDRAGAFVDGFQ
ncbi:PQQ-binding-like beta-propeller repeat protein [Mycobacterium goodii]|uniref:Pyrrolo-quinoline quinone repeat domain-containing protein n=1 Tax=Mycolicibacterium wolinskyi TaxID=59750 RepID=A0A1X2EZ25_9MYCO|nr:PQQ-binding-like beta-propeller repeat protein [Mycolicibacterium goodii]MCV7295416.1 PQQ-binding-like beta-propeller repeat protein [Mycolicibacterium goodii]ORX11470.1 hypothetical protein AWC31_32720 [Mycolicibacterium wolinskyi]